MPPDLAADPVWLVMAVSHPARFQALSRVAPGMWPRVGEALPKTVESFLISTADGLHLRTVEEGRPLVRDTGWVIRARPIERAYWSGSSHPAARFFTDENPHFDEGVGLMVVLPVGSASVSFDGEAEDRPSGRDRFKLFQAGAKKLVAGAPNTLTSAEAEALIADASVLRGISPETASHLLQVGTRRSVKAGETLFEEGDKPGPMMLVLDGDASISLDVGDLRLVVAEVGPGSLVGEMSLLTDNRRSATLVASSDLQLLAVDHNGLREVAATDPELLDRLWRNTGEHLIDNLLRGATPFAGWTAEQRRTWWNAGGDVDLDAGGLVRVRGGALFVYQGEVHIEQPEGFSLVRAPGLVSIDTSARLRSPGGARARMLPSLKAR